MLLFSKTIGGSEVVSLELAEIFHENGHDVFFIFVSGKKNEIKELVIHEKFKVYEVESLMSEVSTKDRINFLTETLNNDQPDILISMFMQESYMLFKAKESVEYGFKTIMVDHQGIATKFPAFWSHRLLDIYAKANAVITVGVDDELYYRHNLSKDMLITTIQNPPKRVFFSEVFPYPRGKKVLALGRLEKIKGFDFLVSAFKKVASAHPEWTLHIYGEGCEKDSLNRLIYGHNLNNHVFIHEFTNSVASVLNEHDIFVLSSRSESYGMALVEALLMGVPSISFDCPNGPRRIAERLSGCVKLVPPEDIEALSNAIIDLITDENGRFEQHKLSLGYRKLIDRDSVYRRWLEVFEALK